MAEYILLLILSFLFLVAIGLFINFSKRRAARSRHGLTGMCHETGGTMCTSCATAADKKEDSRRCSDSRRQKDLK